MRPRCRARLERPTANEPDLAGRGIRAELGRPRPDDVAGDQLKAASDLGVPVVAIGLLYQQGYFRQVIGRNGDFECDLTDETACDRLVAEVNERHGGVDVLINNAGHSIRRSIAISYQRMHDYQRLINLNYLAAVRLTLGFLPGMAQRRSGHVLASSSIGVLSSQPRFSAYIASKAALEAFMRSASAEYRDQGVKFTIVNFPLVRTGMIAPTRAYAQLKTMSPEQAAERFAIVHKPPRLVTPLGRFAQFAEVVAPTLVDLINNTGFHMYPDSAAARGVEGPEEPPTQEAIEFERVLRGLHWH